MNSPPQKQIKEKQPAVLTPEEYAAIDVVQASFERGDGISFDEALEFARKQAQALWSQPCK